MLPRPVACTLTSPDLVTGTSRPKAEAAAPSTGLGGGLGGACARTV
jgi:hypothetical protein